MADLKLTVDTSDLTKAVRTTDQTRQALRFLGQQFARSNDQSAYLRSINQIVNAQNRLQTNSRMSRSEIMRLGAQFRQQAQFADELARAQMQAAAATQGSARGINRLGVITQQSGYQIGDFLVQVQSGTNWMVAFGQQATQVVGTLTLLGGKWLFLGSALGIAIPLLTAVGAALMRTRGAAEDAADGIQTLSDRVRSARQQVADMAFEIEAMRRGFEDFREFALVQAVEEAQDRVRELAREIYELEQLGTVTGPNERELALAQEALRLAQEQLATYQQSREEHEGLTASMERGEEFANNLVTAYETLRNVMGEAGDEFKQGLVDQADALAEKVGAAEEEARQAAEEARTLKEQMAEAKREAEILAALDLKSGIEGASVAAQALAQALGVSLERANGILALSQFAQGRMQGSGGRGGDPRQFMPGADNGRFTPSADIVEQADILLGLRSPRGGGGGGGGADVFTSRIEGLRQLQGAIQAAAEETRLFEQEISLLDSAIENGVINQQQYNDLVAQAEAAYGRAQQGAYDYEAALESLDNTFASSLEDTFMSIIDGSKSAGEAFRDMARQMIAEAMRMLVIRPMIQSLFGGGGGKGGGLFGGLLGGLFRRESGGSMMPNQPYLVGERGPELVIPGRSATVTNANLTERTMSGGQAVNVYQTINVSTGVQQTVRNEIKQLMPQIAESAKSAVVDAKRRGGSYGRAFS